MMRIEEMVSRTNVSCPNLKQLSFNPDSGLIEDHSPDMCRNQACPSHRFKALFGYHPHEEPSQPSLPPLPPLSDVLNSALEESGTALDTLGHGLLILSNKGPAPRQSVRPALFHHFSITFKILETVYS
jgi:hypothetical protein